MYNEMSLHNEVPSSNPTIEESVLVVEDDVEVRDFITIVLEREGFKVVVARNGRAGLETAISEKLDLLITDIRMPEMDGIELVRRVRASKESSRIPILVVTGFYNTHGTDAMVAGADRVLSKPFFSDVLLVSVREALRRGLQRKNDPQAQSTLPNEHI